MSKLSYSADARGSTGCGDSAISAADLSMVSRFLCDEEGVDLGDSRVDEQRRGSLAFIASPVKITGEAPAGAKRPRAIFGEGNKGGSRSPGQSITVQTDLSAKRNLGSEGGGVSEGLQQGPAARGAPLGDLFDADNSRSGAESVHAFKRSRLARGGSGSESERGEGAPPRVQAGAGLHESQAGTRRLMPFCLVKPSSAIGDVTLDAINRRIQHSSSPISVLPGMEEPKDKGIDESAAAASPAGAEWSSGRVVFKRKGAGNGSGRRMGGGRRTQPTKLDFNRV